MAFYEELMQYYEDVFPLTPLKIHWMKTLIAGRSTETLLDVGCATGAFCHALASAMKSVDGFDLDPSMIEKAQEQYSAANVRFRQGDMLETCKVFDGAAYDVITCFGNTFVHVEQSRLKEVFDSIRSCLKEDGLFVGQILNYDTVLDKPVKVLPLIDNERITFERYYDWKNEHAIEFTTVLTEKRTSKVFRNVIDLYPIRKGSLEYLLKQAGFTAIRFYKNYKGEPAVGEHLPLIFVAEI